MRSLNDSTGESPGQRVQLPSRLRQTINGTPIARKRPQPFHQEVASKALTAALENLTLSHNFSEIPSGSEYIYEYDKRTLQLQPGQVDRAALIFQTIKHMQDVWNRVPRLLCVSGPGQLELGYPKGKGILQKLTHVGHHRRLLRKMKWQDMNDLRNKMLHDISRLYDAHVAYVPVFSELLIVSGPLRTGDPMLRYAPFLDSFDYDLDVKDDTVPWETLKMVQLKKVRAQFNVLQVSQSPCLTRDYCLNQNAKHSGSDC